VCSIAPSGNGGHPDSEAALGMQISGDKLHEEAAGLRCLVFLVAAHLKEDRQGGGGILQYD
jgi:hypothetical protein